VIVVDASALLATLLGSPRSARVLEHVARGEDSLHAPHLVDLEITHALRRFVMLREISDRQARERLQVHLDLQLVRHDHLPLLPRIWELRRNLTAYDAAYVALAELLECPLLTCDARLARSAGHSVEVQVLN
jgi:predicted nucleic acid-binding protein